MKNWLSNLFYLWVIIIVFLLIKSFIDGFKHDYNQGLKDCLQQDSIVLIYDTIFVQSTRPAELEEAIPSALPLVIDTAAVIAAFYEKREFTSRLENEEIKIKVNPFVFRNNIDSVRIRYQILRPETQIFNSLKKPEPNRVFFGAAAAQNFAGPQLVFQRKKWQFSTAYDLTGSQSFRFGVAYRIFSW